MSPVREIESIYMTAAIILFLLYIAAIVLAAAVSAAALGAVAGVGYEVLGLSYAVIEYYDMRQFRRAGVEISGRHLLFYPVTFLFPPAIVGYWLKRRIWVARVRL